MITLNPPLEIAPSLEPGVLIGDAWVTIQYSMRPGRNGRTRYQVRIIRPDGSDVVDDSIQSGYVGGTLRDGLASALSFLAAFGEANRPGRVPIEGDNHDLFDRSLAEWAYQNQDELSLMEEEVRETPDCMVEQ